MSDTSRFASTGWAPTRATVCLDHVVDRHLRRAAGEPTENECSICGRIEDYPIAVSLDLIMPTFVEGFLAFNRSPDDLDEGWADAAETWPVYAAVLSLGQDAFGALRDRGCAEKICDLVARSIRAMTGPAVTQWFTEMELDDLSGGWSQFSELAKHASRFVTTHRSPLAAAFPFLALIRDNYVDGSLSLIRTLPSGETVFRARLLDTLLGEGGPKYQSAADLGPPPPTKATASRMSPAGISMFYCSDDQTSAIAEVAAHGIEPYAVVGEFLCQRTLRILDLTALPDKQPSPFDPRHRQELRMLYFLADFVDEISKPVVPDGRQHIDYAPTQVLTEFLRWTSRQSIDGIAFPSSQSGRRSLALFANRDDFDSTEHPAPETKEPERPWFTLQSRRTRVYRINRRVEPEVTQWRVNDATWIASPARRGDV